MMKHFNFSNFKLPVIVVLAILGLFSCKKTEQEDKTEETKTTFSPITDEMLENAVIYEANIRQYSEEGTFDAFTKDIPQLKELGVKIIWLMPIFPISETKRKATGDKFVSDLPAEDQAKYLGSYYAVSDFRKVNPEFGTIENVRKLVQTAHENGMYVILDWVPNHTGWDHHWLTDHPDFYTKNADGEITDPLNDDGTPVGWADVADLDYSNPELRKTMIADMTYWIENENIDGFRCDVAGSVPTTFWKEAIPQLRAKKDIFMLAEAWEPELMHGNLFDMAYGWDRHHTMNHIATGDAPANEWFTQLEKDNTRYENDDILMNFVTNHDENSWNGTIEERLGNGWEAITALAYLTDGMPLIYSGQEYGLKHRLKFFEKDEIPHVKGKEWQVLKKLGTLKRENKALNGGKHAAKTTMIETQNEYVIAFTREKNNQTVTYLANLSNHAQTIQQPLSGSFTEYMTGKKMEFNNTDELTLSPWQYFIIVND